MRPLDKTIDTLFMMIVDYEHLKSDELEALLHSLIILTALKKLQEESND